ncbi:MAG: hypothetical protein KIT57_13265 [Blastocatellales bacterium]|nr:hypothetical protein [Blastocatellales bacterium]
MDFVLVAKPSSHEELFDWVEDLDRLGECVKESGKKGRPANADTSSTGSR